LNVVHKARVCDFLPLLEQRITEIPGMAGFAFSVSEASHCAQFYLTHHGVEVVTGGVAWGAGASDTLWRWLGDYFDHLAPWVPGRRSPRLHTPPALPWLGVVRTLNLALIRPRQAKKITTVERDLALALIQRALTRN
jgi:hypothetical protein